MPFLRKANPTPRRWPVRLILVGIVFALVLPGLVFCAVLVNRIANGERVRSQEAIHATALRIADALDRELASLSAALVALATSPALDTGDMPAFAQQAATLAQALGQAVVLSDLEGQQLVNTRRPYGTPLPRMQSAETLAKVVASAAPAVSNLFMGATTNGLSVVVMQPVLRDGRVRCVLAISLQPLYLSGLLRQQGLPPGWLATVTDAAQRIVARNEAAERALGQSAARQLVGDVRLGSDLWIGDSFEGVRVLGTAQRLRMAPWTVAVDAPIRAIEAPLRGTIALIGVTGAATLLVAVLLAWTLARSLAAPLQRLSGAGALIARGEPVPDIGSSIAEVDAVSAALVQATSGLERQVAARTAELQQANARLREEMAAREEAEALLRQSQKMEAVGQLTGGIAHDFNNLLTIVIGSIDLLRRRATGDRERRLLDNAMEGAARAATLTARLLAFSRRQPLMPQPVDVNRLVSGMSDLLHRTLGEAVQLETVLVGGLWPVHADPNQLENALLNLAVNGRDALSGAGGEGVLTIATLNVSLGAAALDPGMAPGDYVQVAVTDTGAGMAPEVAARVFEPFYTTKPQGQGTGLGLSQVHGFVKQSGGRVTIRTAPGEGTTVAIILPRFEGDTSVAPVLQVADPAPRAALIVLLVEDDSGVRRTSAESLRELGHSVLEAADAGAALRLLDAHPEISLLLTDVVLPGRTGVVLAAEARSRRPGLPVLFASGYTGPPAADGVPEGALPPGAALLQKPFTMQALALKIGAVMDG